MSKVAKLVCVTMITRVIVDENASDEEILELVGEPFNFKLKYELSENLEYIKDDEEMPFDLVWDT